METYAQMKKRHQDEVNALPLMFAFSNDQFDDGCRKLGVTDPKSELYSLGGTGGFYRRSDDELVSGTFLRHKVEFAKAMKDSDFAIGAFSYEIANIEYDYSYNPEADMAACFDYPTTRDESGYTVIDWSKVENGETLAKLYKKAVARFLAKTH